LRKFLIVAVAAITVVAVTTVALAQTPGATMSVTLKPKKAGSKQKPKDTSLSLEIVNSDFSQTASRIEVWLPKSLRFATAGKKKCSIATLGNGGPSACPTASKIGGGTAVARGGVNVNPTNPLKLPFKVTAFLTGKKSLAFYIKQVGGNIEGVAPAKIRKASGKYGSKLDISIPEIPAQQYPPGNYNGLERLKTTLGSTKKGKSVLKSIGCKNKKAPFKARVHFVANPNPPKVATVETTANAACS
jgi:hypothetical protein